MKAAFYEAYGPARDVLRVGELADPHAGPGEVRVRLSYSGVNPSDCNCRLGIRDRPGWPLIIPHSDGTGVIDEVGPGVDAARLGERVWVWNAQRGRPFGTAAEFVALPAAQAVRLPDGTPLEAGACLGVPAMTAYFALFADGPLRGLDVLVTGGAGAVGHYAVQFARLAGARITITTVSGPAKAAHAASAEPDLVIDYRREDVVGRIMDATEGRGIDRIAEVDFGGNLAVTQAVLKDNGVIGAYASRGAMEPVLPFYPLMFKNVTLRLLQCYAMPAALRAAGTEDVTRWAEAGALVHAVGRIFPLDDIVSAHEAVEQGTVIGKVLVAV
jgi:NADPH2:quinone reductase